MTDTDRKFDVNADGGATEDKKDNQEVAIEIADGKLELEGKEGKEDTEMNA
jgi:hypothetical protein